MRHLIPMLFLLLATPALAEETHTVAKETEAQNAPELPVIKDWGSLLKILRQQGINTSQVDWRTINRSCMGLKDARDANPYNRCRYDMVLTLTDYRADSANCDDKALVAYPNHMTMHRALPLETTTTMPNTGTVHTSTQNVIVQPLSPIELKRARNVAYRDCMYEREWRNPDNWQQGRKH